MSYIDSAVNIGGGLWSEPNTRQALYKHRWDNSGAGISPNSWNICPNSTDTSSINPQLQQKNKRHADILTANNREEFQ